MSKAPFGPKVAGRIAFFFGPIAGALVSVVSLRRMGFPLRSKRILLWTLLAAVVLAVVLILIPDALGRVVGLAAEILFYLIYPRLQEAEFAQWQNGHPGMQPSSGWGALGWGFAGLLLFVVVGFLTVFLLMILFPSLQ
jgi:hypothetical protein